MRRVCGGLGLDFVRQGRECGFMDTEVLLVRKSEKCYLVLG